MWEKTLESPLNYKIKSVDSKGNQSWILIGRIDTEAETPILRPSDAIVLTHWKRPRCWERVKEGGKGDDRGWDGWMASPTQWTCVGVNSRSWWWTGRPGVLRFMGSQTVGHDWATELNWTGTAILGAYQTGEFIFQCYIFLPFHTVHGVLQARILKWFAISFSCRPQYHGNPSLCPNQ